MDREEASGEESAVLAEFRAGRLLKEGSTMKPDLTKGKLQTVHGDDGLIHFQWAARDTNVVHEDLIVFPGDAKLVAMPQKRCYMLEFAQGALETLVQGSGLRWPSRSEPTREASRSTYPYTALSTCVCAWLTASTTRT
jgi:hypothetical protein